MSSNNPTQNPVNNDARDVKVFEADEVEFHYEAGNPIPTGATVKGQPDVVNFIAKTNDPGITISILQGDGAQKVVEAQRVHHQNVIKRPHPTVTVMKTVRLEKGGVDGQPEVKNTGA